MIETIEIYDERKNEIEFYYSVMVDFEYSEINDENRIQTIDNAKFFRIMKSNFLLMLYNLVESTISTGIKEIYDSLKNDNCSYKDVISEIQNIWRNYKIREIYNSTSELKAYTNRVKKIVEDITNNAQIILKKNMLNISGNLDAKKIKDICDNHRIRYSIDKTIDDSELTNVKNKRNALAHGTISFSECARNLTLSDLETIKNTVLNFISLIIQAMEKYCNEKLYLQKNNE